MNIGPREHLTWDTDSDTDDVPCIHAWDGNYPDEDDNDNDTPYMYEDDNDEATSLEDSAPF